MRRIARAHEERLGSASTCPVAQLKRQFLRNFRELVESALTQAIGMQRQGNDEYGPR